MPQVSSEYSLCVTREMHTGSVGQSGRVFLGLSGGEDQSYWKCDAEVRELREELQLYKNSEKKQGRQCEPAGEEGGFVNDE